MSTSRYTLQRFIARHIVPGHRIGICCVSPSRYSDTYNGHVTVHHDGESCRLRGLSYCEGVWVCPVCSGIIRNRRNTLSQQILTKTIQLGYELHFMTLTLSHTRDQSLADVLKLQSAAWRKVVTSKAWRQLSEQRGSKWFMRSLEVTYGSSGWHPHYHFVVAGVDGSAAVMAQIVQLWRDAVHSLGGTAVDYAQNVVKVDGMNLQDLAHYVASWGGGDWSISREVTADTKAGRRGGRSPFQLAADAMMGDDQAAQLYAEYVIAIRGKKAQQWSRLWLAAVNVTDEEVNDETVHQHELTDDTVVIAMPSYNWPELGSERERFIDAVIERDLSTVYDIADRQRITLSYVQMSYFLGGERYDLSYAGGASREWAAVAGADFRAHGYDCR